MKNESGETLSPESGGPQSKFGKWYSKNKEHRIEYMRNYRALNREKVRATSREHNAAKRISRPEYFMLANARQRASDRGQPCTITEADIVIPSHCPLLGAPLQAQLGLLGSNSPSLDRIDSSKGYVPGNVWVISHKANSMKRDATPSELVAFAHALIKTFKDRQHD